MTYLFRFCKELSLFHILLDRYNLGAFFYATNYFARAKYQFTESHRIFLAFVGPDHKDTIDAKLALDEVSQMV